MMTKVYNLPVFLINCVDCPNFVADCYNGGHCKITNVQMLDKSMEDEYYCFPKDINIPIPDTCPLPDKEGAKQ